MRISVAPLVRFKIEASPLIAPTRFTALAGTGERLEALVNEQGQNMISQERAPT